MQTAVCVLVCVGVHARECACLWAHVRFLTLSALCFDGELEVKGQDNITGCLFGAFPPCRSVTLAQHQSR